MLNEIASLAINAIVSVICSLVVAHYYFKKESNAEKIANQIRYGLQRALIPIIYPQFFDQDNSIEIRPHQSAPVKAGVPYIDLARVPKLPALPGQRLDFLLKILDSGFDLQNPAGVSVQDHNGKDAAILAIGLGYCRFSVMIDKDAVASTQMITVTLEDLGRRRNVQSLPFRIGREGE